MNVANIMNMTAGIVLLACGIVACVWPILVGDYYSMAFLAPEAKTTVRVLGGFCCGVGYLLMHFSRCLHDQRPLLFCVGVILLSFALPRFFGLLMDGFAQQKMVYELVFEVVCLMVVVRTYVKN
jgi:hypothetical protein